ncbi:MULTISPECIES: DUF896 domain-containing protein [Exiguobacterium]|jgi:uncharacterized protein YnzC (UPF0291/DUF896 family)|uniref:UPF0291 protein Exig_1097 n=2 Tax=Exiguobacterium TaxID=33986 RepID=Y1097_EXIS2|nr:MULTISPECIES: DUF896 domain-containing protein [Exiguobacterium]B1YE74.1 RecName: Full=UPF0291 protein Exig_1097 [Exiguobacterium sibiricum 255-15]ACB60576.1 protein of unknown function DUF896 [Exiguobacterium sibiricum 255-15]MCT4792826.1 DUF896 domain-containing protein [Exiguobacterium artemiae]MDW2886139.1 DUF896 domain-containing protein [Exiguobacterium sibiricum]MDX1260872.1 DUF896 domain-containing protein [Exiguobacterium sp. K1]OAN15862.1 hypothetical protein A3783_07995 [Exiguob
MLSQEQLDRINELANKSKVEPLTDAETAEQKELRTAYLEAFRGSFKNQMMGIKIVDEEGTDVTPEKLKQAQEEERNKQ